MKTNNKRKIEQLLLNESPTERSPVMILIIYHGNTCPDLCSSLLDWITQNDFCLRSQISTMYFICYIFYVFYIQYFLCAMSQRQIMTRHNCWLIIFTIREYIINILYILVSLVKPK